MYEQRTGSSSFMNYMYNPLPSPDYTGDSDSDCEVAKELAQRRRQLDEEIARFQAQKDKEFAQFEVELKTRKRQAKLVKARSKSTHNQAHYEIIRRSPSTTPPSSIVLGIDGQYGNLLAVTTACKPSEPTYLIGSSSRPKSTAATVCVDRTNIPGLTRPLAAHDNQVSGEGTGMIHQTREVRLPSTNPAPEVVTPEHGSHECQTHALKSHAGATFTSKQFPSLLPLCGSLMAENDNGLIDEAIIDGTQTEPASPTNANMMESLELRSSSMPIESSMTDTFKVPPTKRAYTSPSTAHRRALAPIICNVNGRKRSPGKRKRVTFQLADRAIVQPSSSYEEVESASSATSIFRTNNFNPKGQVAEFDAQDVCHRRPMITRKQTPIDVYGRRRHTQAIIDTPDEDIGKSMADLILGDASGDELDTAEDANKPGERNQGYFALKTQSTAKDTASIYLNYTLENQTTLKVSDSPNNTVESDRRETRERQRVQRPTSPNFQPPHHSMGKYYPGSLQQASPAEDLNVGFFELDEEVDHQSNREQHLVTDEQVDESFEPQPEQRDAQAMPETHRMGTSVPIDILRPGSVTISSTWIGTFGH